MVDRLTDSQMYKLVELYKTYPCLWNIKLESYKNRDTRDKAYRAIADNLNIPGITVKDIPNKIKNLRSSYYQEIKRIEKSKQSGVDPDSVYKPKVSWFTMADGFLRKFRSKRDSSSTFLHMEEPVNTASDNDSEAPVTEQIGFSYMEENSVDDGDENIETNLYERRHNEISSSGFVSTPKKTSKTVTNMNKSHDEVYKAIDRLDQIARNITSNTSKEDEYDVFGKYIATTLRSLPRELAIIAKTEVQKALSDIQLRALRQHTQAQVIQPTMPSYVFSTSSTGDPLNPGYVISIKHEEADLN